MRLHGLEITAFGPFSGTERVDFDALADAGLFLLCGPTGAGKTSILDAVCFGLYGDVPGDRNAAKRLRSDHAPSGVAPRVVLEVSIGSRRFRLTRSPAWERPKKRGTGATRQQAAVILEERAHGEWTHLSSRLDETGQMVTELLGMNLNQFCQVAMLPQGRFQAFLRARSDERHKVLQQLFRTSRFEEIERWLVAHRQGLKATNGKHQEATSAVVSRICEAAGADLPADWDLHELVLQAESGALRSWTGDLLDGFTTDAGHAADGVESATAATARARVTLEAGQAVADQRRRHTGALAERESLAAGDEQAEQSATRLDTARRASAVRPLATMVGRAEGAVTRARQELASSLAEAARLADTAAELLTHDDLAAAQRDAEEAATVARALLPREVELASAQRTLEQTTRALDRLRAGIATYAERAAEIPPEIAELRSGQADLLAAASRLPYLEQAEEQLQTQLGAAREAEQLREQVRAATSRLHASIDTAQALREKMHEVREARINGMAAELAVALASGGSCPVCGSHDHPSPAHAVRGAPGQADEDGARTAYEDADFARQAHAETVRTLEQNLAVADQRSAALSVSALSERITDNEKQRRAGLAAREQHAAGGATIQRLEAEHTGLQAAIGEVRTEIARTGEQREHAERAVTSLTAEIGALFTDDEFAGDLTRLIESRSAAGATFGAAKAALAAHDDALTRWRDADQEAEACAREHGFDGVQEAIAAQLSDDEIAALEGQLRRRDEARLKVDAVLTDADVVAAATAEPPDLSLLGRELTELEEELSTATTRAKLLAQRAARLDQLTAELDRELAAWAPTRAAYAVAQSVSALVEGKGADNQWQMRLSAYVLSARLGQVVAAANERLATMSDRRYALEQSAARGVGEVRGGLSLQVRDEWTGESRDPVTLSGGETFVVSLALALGLADVVTHEAGGTSIDTLFIDEGFGTLDAETLDDVMDTLDSLRDGGRVVGVVSHVAEMRTRITTQLQIDKDRAGSHVRAIRATM